MVHLPQSASWSSHDGLPVPPYPQTGRKAIDRGRIEKQISVSGEDEPRFSISMMALSGRRTPYLRCGAYSTQSVKCERPCPNENPLAWNHGWNRPKEIVRPWHRAFCRGRRFVAAISDFSGSSG